jgi:hypothetical protein
VKPIVFAGPTLYGDSLLGARDVLWRPPAKEGDVYKAAREMPIAIGIIDGVFETAFSIWHKEILWALSRGIHVFGAASMGALRAAELAPFGMRGIGTVFEQYRDRILNDDDEVAVLHVGAELGFRPLSEALVDMRATIERAQNLRVVSERDGDHILATAKATFYKERSWTHVLKRAATTPARKKDFARLLAWLDKNKVERKRDDARAMISAMRVLAKSWPGPFVADFEFQKTCFWRQFVRANRRTAAQVRL